MYILNISNNIIKKTHLIIASFLMVISGFCQETTKFDWKKPVYHEARAFLYALDKEGDCGLVIKNNKLTEYSIDTNGQRIDKEILDSIIYSIANL